MTDEFLNVQSNRKALSSIWATLCANYEGTNIKNSVVKLLNMYRPEDGIEAYGRLLKALIVLLEDCNNNDLRNFTSMIPPPIGFSEQITKEIFFNATGFMRIDGPIFQQDYSYVFHEKKLIKNKDKSKENKNIFKYSSVPASDFEPEAVSDSEITNPHIMYSQKSSNCNLFQKLPGQTVYTYDKNVLYPHYLPSNHYPSHHYFMKNHLNSLYLPPTSCQNAWNFNQIPLLIKSYNKIQSNAPCRNLLVKTMDNKFLRLPITSCNMSNAHCFKHHQNQESSEKDKNESDKYDLLNNTSQKIIDVPEVPKNIENEKWSKEEELNNSEKYNYQPLEKEKIKFNEEKNDTFFLPFADNILESLTVNKNLKASIENFLNRLKQDVSTQESSNKTPNMNTFIGQEKSSFPYSRRTISSPFSQKKNNLSNELKPTNNSSVNQTNSINELAAHKQQYYDALLSVQRAKMAVANSLTLSSSQSYGNFDSCYPNYGQQHHWTTQQPQAKAMHKSPTYPKLFHSQYSHSNDPYSRGVDWNSYSSSRIRKEFPLIHASHMYGSRYMYNISNDISQYSDLSPKWKTTAGRRKLNNTTVELTKDDTNNMHY